MTQPHAEAPQPFPCTTPEPPYFAVVFSSVRRPGDDAAYAETAARMSALAAEQPGYLGMESVRDADGRGLTVSYWTDQAAIAQWREHAEHLLAQRRGRDDWYADFQLRICEVQAARAFHRSDSEPSGPPSFAELATARKTWIHGPLRDWCRRASRKDLLLAEQDWFDIAGKADPVKTLWVWAWSRFPALVLEDLGIDETAEVVVELKSGSSLHGYPDARQSVSGRLVLVSPAGSSSPVSIDDITTVRRSAS